jgi:hypothetical protein
MSRGGLDVQKGRRGGRLDLFPHIAVIEYGLGADGVTITAPPGIAAAAAGTELIHPNSMQIDLDSDFYCYKTEVSVFDTFAQPEGYNSVPDDSPESWHGKVIISEEGGGTRYSNGPICLGHLFGRPSDEFYWPAPAIFRAGSTVTLRQFERFQFAETPCTARFGFHGYKLSKTSGVPRLDAFMDPTLRDVVRRFRGRRELYDVEPFFYGINFDDLNVTEALAATQGHFTVSDHAFIVTDIMGSMFDAGGAGAAAGFPQLPASSLVQLATGLGKVPLQNIPFPMGNGMGVGRRPMHLPAPLIIEQGDTLTAVLSHVQRSTATNFNWDAYLTFVGVRIFSTARY